MKNSDCLWKGVFVWLSIIYNLQFAGVHGLCLDQDGLEGLCVASRYCRRNTKLVPCGGDFVCCTFQPENRGGQPSWDNTTKAPTHSGRETERPPYDRKPPRATYDNDRPEKTTETSVRATTEPGRPNLHPPNEGTIAPHIPADVDATFFHPCFTQDHREGLCVSREQCLEAANLYLVKCWDDAYCCEIEFTNRSGQPSQANRTVGNTTTKAPTRPEREYLEPSYHQGPPYDDNRPRKPTKRPYVQPTTETPYDHDRPSKPTEQLYDRPATQTPYDDNRPEKPTEPSIDRLPRTPLNGNRRRRTSDRPPPPPPTPPTKPHSTFPHPDVHPLDPELLPKIQGCGQKHSVKKNRGYVVGGHDAKEHWPWMAAIHVSRNGFRPRFKCAGSLITIRHVLTIAHCFDTRQRGRDTYSVLVGTSNITTLPTGLSASPSGQFIDVLNIRIHEHYVQGVHYNDIALLILESKVPLSDLVSPVCLPSSTDIRLYANITETGWGSTTGGSESKFLQETELQLIPSRICKFAYEEFKKQGLSNGITADMLCAEYPTGGLYPCKGDSGSPLVGENEGTWVQLGIAAFGVQCGSAEYPDVFTRVSTFMGWITRILSEYQRLI